jgi:hypothetical protein
MLEEASGAPKAFCFVSSPSIDSSVAFSPRENNFHPLRDTFFAPSHRLLLATRSEEQKRATEGWQAAQHGREKRSVEELKVKKFLCQDVCAYKLRYMACYGKIFISREGCKRSG